LDSSASGEGRAAGPFAFLRICADAFNLIEQHGRHSANMAGMPVDHPDVLAFIDAKAVDCAFEHFNRSIALTNIFTEESSERSPSTMHMSMEW
jgi:ribonucleoside-diphosphate reductase alpha chain